MRLNLYGPMTSQLSNDLTNLDLFLDLQTVFDKSLLNHNSKKNCSDLKFLLMNRCKAPFIGLIGSNFGITLFQAY